MTPERSTYIKHFPLNSNEFKLYGKDKSYNTSLLPSNDDDTNEEDDGAEKKNKTADSKHDDVYKERVYVFITLPSNLHL